MRRHDWLVNAIQILIETFLFYHPAVWWISNRVRHERELCCDDIALAVVGDRATYGRMLLALEELRHANPSVMHGAPTSLAATGGNLIRRVRRLMLGAPQTERASSVWLSGAVLVTAIFVLGVLVLVTINSQRPVAANQTQSDATNHGAQSSKNVGEASPRNREPVSNGERKGEVAVPQRYLTQITPKLSMELIAVTMPEFVEDVEMPSESGEAKVRHVWWRPDGTRFDQAPDAPKPQKVSLRSVNHGDQMREFLVRVDGLEHPHSIFGYLNRGKEFTDQERNVGKGTVLVRMAGRFDTDPPTRSTDLFVQLADEAWGPVQQISPDAKPINSIVTSDDNRIWYDGTRPLQITEVGRLTQISFATSPPSSMAMDFHLVAIDIDGVSHTSTNDYGRSFGVSTVKFPIPLARLKQVEYKFRTFRNLVIFRNVSLDAGYETKVEVETQTLAHGALTFANANKSDPSKPDAQEIELKNGRIRTQLNCQTELNFIDIPLRDALEYVQELHHIAIEFDPTATDLLTNLKWNTVTLRNKSENLASCMMLLLSKFDLSYLVDDGKLIIATPEEVQRRGADLPPRFNDILAQLSEYPTVRWDSLLRGEFDQADAQTIEDLQAALDDTHPIVQQLAAKVLYQFAKSARSALPGLKKAAKSNDWRVRRAAYFALAAIAHDDLGTLPLLIEAWPNDEVVRDDWIGLMREFDGSVYTELERLFPKVTAEFRLALVRSTSFRAISAKNLLLLGLADDDELVRRTSLYSAVVMFRSDHRILNEFVGVLRPLLKSEDAFDRRFVASLLISTPGETDAAFQTLMQLIAKGSPGDRDDALVSFRVLPQNKWAEITLPIIERLNKLVESGPAEMRPAAMMALGALHAPIEGKSLDFNWGANVEGLQSQLSAVALNPTTGESFMLRLEIRDADKKSLSSDKLPDSLKGMLRVLGPESKAIFEIELSFSNKSLQKSAEPYEVLTFDAKLNLKKLGPATAGKYLLQFGGKNFPMSNVFTLDVTEAKKGDNAGKQKGR